MIVSILSKCSNRNSLLLGQVEIACALLFLVGGSAVSGQTRGLALGLSSAEVNIAVGRAESEITATLQYKPRPATITRNRYDLYIPVHVPTGLVGNASASKKYKPALSVERRPVIIKRAEPPASIARIDTLPGMSIVWWKAVLRWPRRGEPLIVDMRYLQSHGVVGRAQSCMYVPIIPDGALTKESRVTLHTDLTGIALHLRSGKLRKENPLSKWIGKRATVRKRMECALQHKLPIIVDLVTEK